MAPTTPFLREAGSGPSVICLHSNASHSGQWRGLMDRLAGRFQVLAVDSYGSGRTPDWPSDSVIALADEVALLQPVLARASQPAFLVGHSYGAAIALKAALLHPGRFAALALYEPTPFALVHRVAPQEVDGIVGAVRAASECLDAGDEDGAARCFIDFWMGEGSWARMPAERKPAMAQSVRNVRRWAHALMTESTALADLQRLTMPVLLMKGGRSPRSSLSVAEVLLCSLPKVRPLEFPGLGHMAPVTHPEPLNAAIERFLLDVVA